MKIRGNFNIENREKPQIFTKYEEDTDVLSHLTKVKKKKLYNYYLCDYCGNEIKIKTKGEEKTGGTITLSETLTKRKRIKIVCCNKCLAKVIREFEEVS